MGKEINRARAAREEDARWMGAAAELAREEDTRRIRRAAAERMSPRHLEAFDEFVRISDWFGEKAAISIDDGAVSFLFIDCEASNYERDIVRQSRAFVDEANRRKAEFVSEHGAAFREIPFSALTKNTGIKNPLWRWDMVIYSVKRLLEEQGSLDRENIIVEQAEGNSATDEENVLDDVINQFHDKLAILERFKNNGLFDEEYFIERVRRLWDEGTATSVAALEARGCDVTVEQRCAMQAQLHAALSGGASAAAFC